MQAGSDEEKMDVLARAGEELRSAKTSIERFMGC
jgi:hypothetical protein